MCWQFSPKNRLALGLHIHIHPYNEVRIYDCYAVQVRDMTGGALKWLSKSYPGACFSDRGINYVCVGGRTVRGSSANDVDEEIRRDASLEGAKEKPRRSTARYAYDSYQQVRVNTCCV